MAMITKWVTFLAYCLRSLKVNGFWYVPEHFKGIKAESLALNFG